MQTSAEATARTAVGPLRRLIRGPDGRMPPFRPGFVRNYLVPLGVLGLLGLGVANMAYLQDARDMSALWSGVFSIGAVLPVVVAVRRPLLGWRIAYPMLYLGTMMARESEPWPWPTVQILGFLAVLAMVSLVEDAAVTVWVVALSALPPFLYAAQSNAFGVVVLLVAIALVGDALSRRRQSRARLAEQTELTELERARRAILEERARIAREMHDVVAHHMSMIAVQAETAPFRLPELPEAARDELATIAASARSALADMRRLLGVLRADSENAPREPQPGLADLPKLVTAAQRAGMAVSFELSGDGKVPEPTALAAYRIIQEALANAGRHAPGAPVRATVLALPDRLDLTVHSGRSTVVPVLAPGEGHGVIGMRERAELLGGTFSAGPDPSGGYVVTASLPYGVSA